MSQLFKKQTRLVAIIGSVFLVVTLLAASLAFLANRYGLLPALDKPSESQSDALPVEAEPEEDLLTPMGSEQEQEPEPEPAHFNVPSVMRGVFLTPGVDYMKTGDTTEATLRAEIDQAVENLSALTMNSAIILTDYDDKVIYQTLSAPELSRDFDIMGYIVDRCRAEGVYVYAVFNISHYENGSAAGVKMAAGAGEINPLRSNLEEFAKKYQLDGILIDGYTNEETSDSYNLYTLLGGAIGYRNYMRHTPEAMVNTAAAAIRKAAPSTQVGLLASGVWANNYENEEGTATKAAFSSLIDGNADTRAFVESGILDFITVKAYGALTSDAEPFKEIAAWWSGVAGRAGVPLYIVHASSKACTDEAGWQAHDQLAKQAIELDSIGADGSIFNSLQRLVEDPKEASTTLIKYYRREVNPEHILTELAVTKPEKTTYTTSETVVTFTGASDPNSKVTINGTEIKTDQSGYFTVSYELKGGLNEFAIEHKEKTVRYAITREINILKDISPQGSIATDGSMDITITAWAYEEAEVYATVGGTTVTLRVDESVVDEQSRDSSYKYFSGIYTAPPATSSVQSLGGITVTAKWGGETKSLQGASISVNKKAKIEDGVPVVVVADQAMTYPPSTLNNIPDAKYYPLPKGAMDYAVGSELTYAKNGVTYKYTVLASGLRVESKDIQASSDYASGNTIKGLSVKSENGFTYVTLDLTQKVSYSVTYTGNRFSVLFHNTTKSPSTTALGDNPLFTEAAWSGGCTLDLKMVKSGGFMGYKAYYDETGKLVFRFNNPPSSLSGARIAIDPGHGGKDPGTLGFLKDYPERVINRQIAAYLKAELENRGATVYLIDTSGGMSLNERVSRAEQWNADVFVSVHNNAALNASAKGTEVYYFYPFAKTLADSASANVSSRLSTTNRGGKQSYYQVTLSSQFPSVLVECGFMSNKDEYEKLIHSGYQNAIATGIADSLAAGIKAAYTGISGGTTTGAEPPPPSENTGEEGVWLSDTSLTLGTGKTYRLTADAWLDSGDPVILWSSSNEKIATVSDGTVKGMAEGKVTITASLMNTDLSATCTVTVGEDAATTTTGSGTPTEIFIIPYGDTATVEAGAKLQMEIEAEPASASRSVNWSSSNTKVATVSANGTVTGVAGGTATITATSTANSKVSYECVVTVVSVSGKALSSASDIEFIEDTVYLYKGTSGELLIDSNVGLIRATDFTWKSSDTGIAIVDSYGVVTAKSKEGEATITATSKDGKKKVSCIVYVTTTKEKVSEIELSDSSLTMMVGETFRLTHTVFPYDAANKQATYKSSRANIVSVDANGNLTALREGTAVITVASAENSKVSATCQVTVIKDDTEIEIDVGSTYTMYVGETEQFEVLYYPDDLKNKEVTWASSKTSVATVDSKGNVTAKVRGTATITVTLKSNPDVKYQCKVTVEN